MRVALVAVVLLVIATAAVAEARDPRVPVDPNEPPWNAVAKVQTNIGTKCTGVLIAPAVVLTAAHCLYNPRTRAMLQPVSLHVLFGYARDGYRWHRLVARFAVGSGFDSTRPVPQGSDWARLTLAEPVPVPPLSLYEGTVDTGLPMVLAGYNQDRSQLLMADLDCHVVRVAKAAADATFLIHDCAGTHGTSGGPLLAKHNGKWAVFGINIAAGPQTNLALAVPPKN